MRSKILYRPGQEIACAVCHVTASLWVPKLRPWGTLFEKVWPVWVVSVSDIPKQSISIPILPLQTAPGGGVTEITDLCDHIRWLFPQGQSFIGGQSPHAIFQHSSAGQVYSVLSTCHFRTTWACTYPNWALKATAVHSGHPMANENWVGVREGASGERQCPKRAGAEDSTMRTAPGRGSCIYYINFYKNKLVD